MKRAAVIEAQVIQPKGYKFTKLAGNVNSLSSLVAFHTDVSPPDIFPRLGILHDPMKFVIIKNNNNKT